VFIEVLLLRWLLGSVVERWTLLAEVWIASYEAVYSDADET